MTKCSYCGEEKATKIIMNLNLNMDEPAIWNMCADCKNVIQILAKHKDIVSKATGGKIICKKKEGGYGLVSVRYTGEVPGAAAGEPKRT